MREIAALLEMAPAQVLGTCSFYTMYKRDHVRALVVSVCTNVSCLVNGGPELYEDLAACFGADETILVEEVECLAVCDAAPVVQVNYDFHGNQTTEGAVAMHRRVQVGRVDGAVVSPAGGSPDGRAGRRASSRSACASSPKIRSRWSATSAPWWVRVAAPCGGDDYDADPGRAREGVGSARPGWCRIRHRSEVVVPPRGPGTRATSP